MGTTELITLLFVSLIVAMVVHANILLLRSKGQQVREHAALRRAEEAEKLLREAVAEARHQAAEAERLRLAADEASRKAEEATRQFGTAEEARHKAETEIRHLAEEVAKQRQRAEEALRRAEEAEQQLQVTRAVLHRAQAELGRQEETPEETPDERDTEEPTPGSIEQPGGDVVTDGKRLAPPLRGGHPRGAPNRAENPETPAIKVRRPKPEIVCWKREREWILAVEVPDELLDNPALAVFQNGIPLLQDKSGENCWHLQHISGQVVVQWDGDGVTDQIEIFLHGNGYLVFKLSDQDRGHRVKYPSTGLYLVVVPENWVRNEEVSGPPLVTPEPTSIVGYQAHYFEFGRGSDWRIVFDRFPDTRVLIEARTPRFELVGTQLRDATEGVGPLFGESPPRIRALDETAWENVSMIVVGQEGRGRKRWRTHFSSVPEKREQDLPPELADRRCGWYFLRLYGRNDDLVESLDFRFIAALSEIYIPQTSPVPADNGHMPARVEFLHSPGCTIRPDDAYARRVQLDHAPEGTLLTIPPDPLCDKTQWFVDHEMGSGITVTIRVDRVWWQIGEEGRVPSEWTDTVLTLAHADLRATSNKALWLRFPSPRWTHRVHAGFAGTSPKEFSVRVTDQTLSIPLREFGESTAMEQRDRNHDFKIWLDGQTAATVAVLPQSKLRCRRDLCGFVALSQREILDHIKEYHLWSYVKPLTYPELREKYPSLPREIYKCGYCSHYVPSDVGRLDNPTSAIIRHIEKDCTEVDRSVGPTQIKFEVVHDTDQIRKYFNANLPRVDKCTLCGRHFDNASPKDLMAHLQEQHQGELYGYEDQDHHSLKLDRTSAFGRAV